MATTAKTRSVRVGHDFVPRSGHCYIGFRAKGSFTMEMTQEQIDFLNEIRKRQIRNGEVGTPILELIPDEVGYAG